MLKYKELKYKEFILLLPMLYIWLVMGNLFKDLITDVSLLNLKESFLNIIGVHAKLLTIPVVLMVFNIIKKDLKILDIILILLISIYLPIYEWCDTYIHYGFLLKYYVILGYSMDMNPQYTRIWLTLFLILVNFGLAIKNGGLDRYFISIINIGVLITVMFFHLIGPMGFLVNQNEYRLNEMVKSLENKNLNNYCFKTNCMVVDKEFNLISQSDLNGKYDYEVLKDKKDLFKNNINMKGIFGINGNLLKEDKLLFNYMAVVKIVSEKQDWYFYDIKNMQAHSRLSEIIFVSYVIIAHSVWIFGFLLLLFIHKKKELLKSLYIK